MTHSERTTCTDAFRKAYILPASRLAPAVQQEQPAEELALPDHTNPKRNTMRVKFQRDTPNTELLDFPDEGHHRPLAKPNQQPESHVFPDNVDTTVLHVDTTVLRVKLNRQQQG